ncbi:hypothetical protein FQN49_002031 [Arthroderma sp. PD_2]|nr:hypothetical protein FQN49_002031 [Arthroderma sp. PD_2]
MSSLLRCARPRHAVSLISPCLAQISLRFVKPTYKIRSIHKANSASPSDTLLLALHQSNIEGYTSSTEAGISSRLAINPTKEEREKISEEVEKAWSGRKPNYAFVVARYLREIHPLLQPILKEEDTLDRTLDRALLKVFDDETLQYLSRNGYSAGDVMSWAWVLATPEPYTSVMRYKLLLESGPEMAWENPRPRRVPLFVFTLLLRRTDTDVRCFHVLAETASHVFNSLVEDRHRSVVTSLGYDYSPAPKSLEEHGDGAIMVIFVRLAEIARREHPKGLITIAKMFTLTFKKLMGTKDLDQLGLEKGPKLTKIHNRFISVLADWCSVEPYKSSIAQKQAVFHILREMETYNPSLPIEANSYRSITRILLACELTDAERQWDQFKAVSWPPWKEDKLGIDVEKTEGSKTMAMQSIMQLREAGYSYTEWDMAASVVAGWDADGTPTIQKRTILPNPARYLARARFHPHTGQLIWSCRIRATRTLLEAWACYLSLQQQDVPVTDSIMVEMVEKFIHADRLGTRLQLKEEGKLRTPYSPPLSGSKEVYPEPSSPRDTIYVPSQPPTLHEFLQEMFSYGCRLSIKLLALLLNRTTSFKQGLDYIGHSTLTKRQANALLDSPSLITEERIETLRRLPDPLFSSFIQFLCKCSALSTVYPTKRSKAPNAMFPIIFSRYFAGLPNQSLALSHAVFLMELRMSRYMPAWHNIFKAISLYSRPRCDHIADISTGLDRVLAWEETLRLVALMQENSIRLDMKCIQLFCDGFAVLVKALYLHPRAVKEGRRVIFRHARHGTRPENDLTTHTFPAMIEHGLGQLRFHINQLIPLNRGHAPNSSTPGHALAVSGEMLNPAVLHSIMRAFGRGRDWESMVAVLRVLQTEAKDLRRRTEQRRGPRTMLRRTIIASRAFLEYDFTGLKGDVQTSRSRQDGYPFVKKARTIVETTKVLAPWPSDEEVNDYIQREGGSDRMDSVEDEEPEQTAFC